MFGRDVASNGTREKHSDASVFDGQPVREDGPAQKFTELIGLLLVITGSSSKFRLKDLK